MKKYLSIFLAAAMLFVASACALTEKDEVENTNDPVVADIGDVTLDSIVAEVGTRAITLREYNGLFETCLAYISYYYGEDVTADTAKLYSFQDDVMNMLIEKLVVNEMAEQLGYDDLNDEQQAELDSRIKTEYDDLHEFYREQAETAAASDDTIVVEEYMKELIVDEAVSNMGDPNATYEDYLEYLSKEITTTYLAEIMKAGELADLTVDESDVKAEYDMALESDTTAYSEYPEDYKNAQETFEKNGSGLPVMYVPEGYSRIYDIFIPYEGELPAEFYDNEETMDLLKDEYLELAFEDELNGTDTNEGRISEIIEEYKALDAVNAEYYAAYITSAKVKIEDLYAQLQAGSDFYELMAANTENESFIEGTKLAINGMLISTVHESINDWDDAVKEALTNMKPGEFSDPIMVEEGYHIIYYIGDEVPGVRPYEDVYDDVYNTILSSKQDVEWGVIVSEWVSGDMVTRHEEVYRLAGGEELQKLIDAETANIE